MTKPVLRQLVDKLFQYGADAEPKDPKARTRARILRIATDLFQRRGYRHTSVDDVARESGVAKGTVYLHFKNKAELLFHAIAEEKKKLIGEFLPLMQEKLEPKERLRRYIELGLLSLLKAPLISKLMSGDREMLVFLEEIGSDLVQEVRRTQSLGMAALLEGVGDFDRLPPTVQQERIIAFQGLLYSGSQLLDERLRGGMTAERYVHHLAHMIVEGIGAP